MFKLLPDREPQRVSPERIHRVTRAAAAMARVPSDREARLVEIVEAFSNVEINRVMDPPDLFMLRTIQNMAARALAEYPR